MSTRHAFLIPGIGLLGATICLAPAIASDASGGFALHGVGAQTCKMMLQELQPPATPAAAATPTATPAATPATAAAPAAPATPAATPTATPAAIPAAKPDAVASPAAPNAAATPAPSASASAAAKPDASPAGGGASHQAEAAGAPAAAASTTPTAPVAAPSPASAALSLRQILTSWIMGYLTASDRLVKDTFDETPVMAPEALTNMVIGVCRRNPDARVEAVANSVLTQLATARLLHDSPVVEARQGAQTVLIRQATLVAMQKALERDKLLKDPADGKFGGGTAAALLAFQKSQHLPETSLPDSDTVVRLLVEMPAAAPVATKRPRRAR